MKLAKMITYFDGTPILKYGGELFFDGNTVMLESPICSAIGTVEEELPKAIVSFDQVKTMLKHFGEGTTFSIKDSTLLVRNRSRKAELPLVQKDWPDIAAKKAPKNSIKVDSILANKIEMCSKYTSTDISNPVYCSVYIQDNWVQATNRYSFLKIKHEGAFNLALYNTIIIPIILSIAKNTEMRLWKEEHLFVKTENLFCMIPLMNDDAALPSLEELLLSKEKEKEIDCDIPLLFSEVKKMALLCEELGDDKSYSIQADFVAGKIKLSTNNEKSNISCLIPSKHKMDSFKMSFLKETAKELPEHMPNIKQGSLYIISADMCILFIKDENKEFYVPVILEGQGEEE